MKSICIVAMVLFLGGCALGIKDDDTRTVHAKFDVPVTYQEAYRRADAYARQCHPGDVTGNVYPDNQTAIARIVAVNGKDLERVHLAARADSGTDVSIDAWGVGVWDQRELAAAQKAIETGHPACR